MTHELVGFGMHVSADIKYVTLYIETIAAFPNHGSREFRYTLCGEGWVRKQDRRRWSKGPFRIQMLSADKGTEEAKGITLPAFVVVNLDD
ncbi:predicted protein [Coccidioides posadasii str. Silveira]|uniref:Predicted protein n=1 Tax=Coccidioides posadasii (strain RMSCC 757 / Silveira) TaxID=443226 RepID=E9D8F4_COCPS|nr:predicted protein [Coccidioides posadasii str. Silveira]